MALYIIIPVPAKPPATLPTVPAVVPVAPDRKFLNCVPAVPPTLPKFKLPLNKLPDNIKAIILPIPETILSIPSLTILNPSSIIVLPSGKF